MKKTSTTKTKSIKTPTMVKPRSRVYKIDATGKILGRLAVEISILLRGKNEASFQRHIDQGNTVIIKNASKLKITGKKLSQKKYFHYSGYPGGLKSKRMGELFSQNPGEVLKRATWNMLPKNKLRDKMIKRLKISN